MRTLPLLATALGFCVSATQACSFNLEPLPPKPENVARADNACSAAATDIVMGKPSANLSDQIAICNGHPSKRECEATQSFIRENNHGKVPPELTCVGPSAK